MKKTFLLIVCLLISAGLFGYLITGLIQEDLSGFFSGAIHLPSGFPSEDGLISIWVFLLSLSGFAAWLVSGNAVSINRRKNALIIFLIFIGAIYGWNLLLFTDGNLIGSLAMAVAGLLLGLLSTVMFWLIDHNAGYLLFPSLVWNLFSLYLNISLVVLN
ncbi:MAG: tryptophan-rich sensory protein [Flexilinea sp.]